MGSESSSPEKSPSRKSPSRTNRKISPMKHQSQPPTSPKPVKVRNFNTKSNISKVLSSPKNIMNFIANCENAILLKNMNDSNSVSFNHINILFNPDIINPFLESQLKYIQMVEDSIDKKILGKLKISNNLIEINNENTFNNNFNIGNLSSIHKKRGKYLSRDDSPTSQRDDELNLTSFSTTIGGKGSNNISNAKSFGNNKMSNSKQVRTFKIRTKDGLGGDIEYNNYINKKNNNKSHSNSNSRNNSRNISNNSNNNSYRNNLLRKDSPNSMNSNNSSNNNSNSNVLSSINKTNYTNFQPKNSPNKSTKEQNSYMNHNIFSNKIINKKKHNSCFTEINDFQVINLTERSKNMNIKNI